MEPIVLCDAAGQPAVVLDDPTSAAVLRELNGEHYLTFTLPAAHPKAGAVMVEGIVEVAGERYRVRRVRTYRERAPMVEVYAEAIFYDLRAQIVEATEWEATQAATEMAAVLAGTGWTVGTVNVSTVRTWSMPEGSALASLRAIAQTHGGDLTFDGTAKTVSLRIFSGQDNGLTFFYGRGVRDVERVQDTTALVTRIIPRDTNGVGIESVNGGVAWVEDHSFSAENRLAVYTFEAGTSPTQMKAMAQVALGRRANPAYTYQLDVIDPAAWSSHPIDQCAVGDQVTVVDEELGIRVASRVVRMERDLARPWLSKITLSQTLRELGDDTPTRSELQAVQTVAASAEATAAAAEAIAENAMASADGKGRNIYATEAERDAYAPFSTTDTWYDTEHGNLMHRWTGTEWVPMVMGSDAIAEQVITPEKLSAAVADSIEQADQTANAALESADGKGRNIYATEAERGAFAPFSEHDTWYDTANGFAMYEWTGTEWVAAPLGNAAIGNLDAGKITTGYLSADRIEANSLTAEKLLVSGDNLLNNPFFRAGLNGWTPTTPPSAWSVVNIGGDWQFCARCTITQTWHALAGPPVECRPDDQFFISAGVYIHPGTVVTQAGIRISWRDANGTEISANAAGYATTGTYSILSGNFTAPAGSVTAVALLYVSGGTAGQVTFGLPKLIKRLAGSLIVDGTITAAKLQAGTITAESGVIADAAINTAQIIDGAITNAKIGNLDAGKITSGFIDAARIKAGSISANQLLVGDMQNCIEDPWFEAELGRSWLVASGTTATILAEQPNSILVTGRATGNADVFNAMTVECAVGDQFSVTFDSRLRGASVPPNPATLRVIAKVERMDGTIVWQSVTGSNGSTWATTQGVLTMPADAKRVTFGVSVLQGGTDGVGYGFRAVQVRRRITGKLIVNGSITADMLTAGAINGQTINSEDGLTMEPGASIRFQGSSTYARMYTYSSASSTIQIDGALRVSLGLNVGPFGINSLGYLSGNQGNFSTHVGTGVNNRLLATAYSTNPNHLQPTAMDMPSTTGTANVRSSGDNAAIQRVSSLRRYKLNRRKIRAEYGILDLPAMTWRDRAEVKADPDTQHRIAGFVAEDVAAVSAAHGGVFDTLLEVDENGKLAGLSYDRIVAYLIPVVRDINDRVAALEAKEK